MSTIAIVEDNATMRETLKAFIEQASNHRVVCTCACVKDALADIPRLRPDVVLMDIHLPDESGVVCVAKLTEQMPGLHVIMLTVYQETSRIFSALKAGACGYLLKRSRPEEILEAIDQVLAGGAPMTSEIARMVVRSFQDQRTAAKETDSLSTREMELLALVAEGLSNKEIAARLNISPATVRTHLMNVFKKLHVRCRTEAAAKYLKVAPVVGP